jgi:hypothetical protein
LSFSTGVSKGASGVSGMMTRAVPDATLTSTQADPSCMSRMQGRFKGEILSMTGLCVIWASIPSRLAARITA